uniref:Uncharacterized protein n=1 Tax=Rhizophora mucronata TaxID=61149 RepID=A0A2P2K653_RHIMU
MNRLTVAANARISSSMRFSLINNSSTPPFTASTNRSDTRTAFLTASFFAFSDFDLRNGIALLSDFDGKGIGLVTQAES